MKGLKFPHTPKTLVAFDTNDDAGAYQISDDIAIIQTVDFITPVVNDPYKFGQIAAANMCICVVPQHTQSVSQNCFKAISQIK